MWWTAAIPHNIVSVNCKQDTRCVAMCLLTKLHRSHPQQKFCNDAADSPHINPCAVQLSTKQQLRGTVPSVCVCVCVRACVHVCVCGENSRIHDNKMKVPLTLPCINNQDTTTIWQGRMARPFSSVHSSWPTKPRHLNFIIFIHFTATTNVHSMKGYTPQRKDHSRSLTYHPGSPALFAQL